jgi:hypothetical protein
MLNKISIKANSSPSAIFKKISDKWSRSQLMEIMMKAGYAAQYAMQKTTRHGDITGVGRTSYDVVKASDGSLGVDVINTATSDKGFYYMPHIDRGGKAGKGGHIRARMFSQEGKTSASRIFKKVNSTGNIPTSL